MSTHTLNEYINAWYTPYKAFEFGFCKTDTTNVGQAVFAALAATLQGTENGGH